MSRVNGFTQRETADNKVYYSQGANDIELAKASDIPTVTPVSFTAFGSTPNANGASVTGNVITLEPADASNGGGLSTIAQTIAGNKTFTGAGIFGATNPSSAGNIRLPNDASIGWRNSTNSGDVGIRFNSSDIFQIGGLGISVGTITSSSIGPNVMVKTNGSNTLTAAVSNTDYLPVNNAALTGTPTAPTAAPGTNTTQIATTAFVTAAVSGVTSPWTKIGTNLSPTTANDAVVISSSTAGNTISSTNTAAGGAAFYGSSSNGGATAQFDNSGADPTLILKNTSSGQIARFDNATTQSSINNNGSFNWTGATASTDAVFDASKNLISNPITGTGNGVRATSPILVTPNIGAATGTSLNLAGSGIPLIVNSTSSSSQKIQFTDNGTSRGYLGTGTSSAFVFYNASNAEISTINGTTGAYTATSDRNAKKNIKLSGSALSLVNQIPIKQYDWKADGTHEPFGVIAQELYEITPTYASKPEKEGGKWGVSKAEMVPMLIKAIQELEARVKELESK